MQYKAAKLDYAADVTEEKWEFQQFAHIRLLLRSLCVHASEVSHELSRVQLLPKRAFVAAFPLLISRLLLTSHDCEQNGDVNSNCFLIKKLHN